jgi:hypothetical membrane protein
MSGQTADQSPSSARTWAGLAAAGVVLYVLVDIALALVRPGLSLVHNPESDYGVGPFSWLMDLNFLLRGALTACLLLAIVRSWRPTPLARLGVLLLAMWGGFSALLAAFPDDPLGTPATAGGSVHLLLALMAFLGALAGTLVLSLAAGQLPPLVGARGWLLALAAVAVIPLLALLRTGFRADGSGGLYERVFLALELAWILVAALNVVRERQLKVEPSGGNAG